MLIAHDSYYREHVETLISETKVMLCGDEDELMITPSAYDTLWIARVPAIDGSFPPQFPQTTNWILKNQLKDGSWGIELTFYCPIAFLPLILVFLHSLNENMDMHKWRRVSIKIKISKHLFYFIIIT